MHLVVFIVNTPNWDQRNKLGLSCAKLRIVLFTNQIEPALAKAIFHPRAGRLETEIVQTLYNFNSEFNWLFYFDGFPSGLRLDFSATLFAHNLPFNQKVNIFCKLIL